MKKINIYHLIIGIFSLIIVGSFLLPIFNVVWMLPVDGGTPVRVDNFYSLIQLIPVLDYWITTILILLYVLSVIVYGILIVLRIINYNIPYKRIAMLLIYPILILAISMLFFTYIGLIVLLSQALCLILLNNNPSKVIEKIN